MLKQIARIVAQQIDTSTELQPLLVITGPRAVGKTRLSQLLFPAHRRASLSLPTEAARAHLDPAAFLAGIPPPVVIDDVHLAPRLVHHVAREIRARPCPPAGYVLVGSRPLMLAAAADEASDGSDLCLRVDGLSHAEVAEQLRQPLGTVKSWVRRALMALKGCLERGVLRDTAGRA